MRIALTGADGFTGRFVDSALEKAGATTVALDGDLRDKDAVDRMVANADFDRLVHLAGHAFVDANNWRAFYAVNQLGTLNLLEAVARKKPGIRCVLASSAQVYGPSAVGLISEDAAIHPANHYAVSKRAMELGSDLWRDTLDIVVTRPFNYTGVGQGDQYLIPKIVDHFRRKSDRIELGNTWVKRDFGDVRSVAEAYVGLVLAVAAPPVVNICTGAVFAIGDILDLLTAITGHRMDVLVNPAFVRTNDPPVLGGDAKRLCETLPSWQPRAVADTLEWMYHTGLRHEETSTGDA